MPYRPEVWSQAPDWPHTYHQVDTVYAAIRTLAAIWTHMKISILTFDNFNELDSFIALGILNRVKKPNWTVCIAAPTNTVTSMNGVTIQAHETLMQANDADASQ